MVRILAHLIAISFTMNALVKALFNLNHNVILSLWSLPFLTASFFIAFFLSLSLFKKPLGINNSLTMFLITLIVSNMPFFVTRYGGYFPIIAPRNLALSRAAVTLMLVMIPFYVSAIFKLERSLTVLPEANKLQTTGVFSISRHPLYVTYITWYILQIFVFQSWAIIFLSTLSTCLQIIRAKHEEIILEQAFPEYKEYKNKVMWLGRRRNV